MNPPPRHHYPGHYRHRIWAVNGLTVTALGLIPLSAMAAAGQRAGDAITPAVQAVPPPPTVRSQPTGVLELITAPSTTASAVVVTDGGKNGPEPTTPSRACRCRPRTEMNPPVTSAPQIYTPSATSLNSAGQTTTPPALSSPAPFTTSTSTPRPTTAPPTTAPTTTPATAGVTTSTAATTTAATSEAAPSTQATTATSEETLPT